MSKFLVHSSALPRFNDCEGAWAAANLPSLKGKFHGGRETVSKVIGITCHAGAKRFLTAKKELGLILPWEDVAEECNSALELKFAEGEGVITDDVTRSLKEAKHQVRAILREYWHSYVRCVEVIEVEPSDAFDITGCDWLAITYRPDAVVEPGYIDDLKIIKQDSDYKAQLGSYILGYEINTGRTVKGARLLVIRRVTMSSAPSTMRIVSYSREACVNAAKRAIRGIRRVLPEWEETKDFNIFRLNSNSKLCTQNTCRAWGSEICDQWHDRKGDTIT